VSDEALFSSQWRKSSYSGASGGCVEVAGNMQGFIAVRDSKNADSPELIFVLTEWVRFVRQVQGGSEPGV
jgi:heme-degrading monooxygenase HmoA